MANTVAALAISFIKDTDQDEEFFAVYEDHRIKSRYPG